MMNELTQEEMEGIVKAMSLEPPKEQKIPLRAKGAIPKVEFTALANENPPREKRRFNDLPVTIEALFGTTRMNLKEIASLEKGSVIGFNERDSDLISLFANGKKVGEGEIVAVDNHFGIRILSLEEK